MAAPKGNRFWELRSKHGRDKIFSSAEEIWKAACEYFKWCEDTPLMATEAKVINIGDYRSEVKMVDVPKMRAFTIQGLCNYMQCNTGYFSDFEASLKGKEDQESKDFSYIITRIKETIYTQKFTGAAAGFLNQNIIARDLGLTDKKESTVIVEQPLFDDDGDDEEEV